MYYYEISLKKHHYLVNTFSIAKFILSRMFNLSKMSNRSSILTLYRKLLFFFPSKKHCSCHVTSNYFISFNKTSNASNLKKLYSQNLPWIRKTFFIYVSHVMQFPRATSIFTLPSSFNSMKLYRSCRNLPQNLKTDLHPHVTSYVSCTIDKISMFTLQKTFARFTNPTELREEISQTVRSFKSQYSISTFSARSIDHPRNWMSAASVNPIATKLSIYLDVRHSKGTFYAESTTNRRCWNIQGYKSVTMTLRRTRLDTEEN